MKRTRKCTAVEQPETRKITKKCKLRDNVPFHEDYLSSLDNDCLLSVLPYLDRDSVDVMETVSKRMNGIANANWTKPRKMVAGFRIEENNKGFLLRADALTDKDFSLEYKIKSTATSRGIAKSEFQGKKWSLKHVRIVNPRVVPDKIFVAIEKLLSMKLPLKLDLSNILLDSTFLAKLLTIFDGKLPKCMTLDDVNIKDQSEILSFVLKNEISEFFVYNANRIFLEKIDEEFISNFAQSRKASELLLSVTGARWFDIVFLTPKFFPIVFRFSLFKVTSFILQISLLNQFISMGFDSDTNVNFYCLISGGKVGRNALSYFDNGKYSLSKSMTREDKFVIKNNVSNKKCAIFANRDLVHINFEISKPIIVTRVGRMNLRANPESFLA